MSVFDRRPSYFSLGASMEDADQDIRDAFLHEIRKQKNDTEVNIHVLHDKEPLDYIAKRLKSNSIKGEFHPYSDAGKRMNYWQHRCIRSGDKRTGSYRCVGCIAYVSYKVGLSSLITCTYHMILSNMSNMWGILFVTKNKSFKMQAIKPSRTW